MSTLRYEVVGDPIGHSLSPAIHSAAFRWNAINAVYGRRKVGPSGMPLVVENLRSGDLDGVNVTMPNKVVAAGLVDVLSSQATRAGAVNTLWCSDGLVHGDNTDVAGIRWAWTTGGLPDDSTVVILGSGGAAAAAMLALEGRQIMISARHPKRAAALIEATEVSARLLDWGHSVPGAVVVNATPIGMRGEPLPEAALEGAVGLLDMVYGGGETMAVSRMIGLGLPAIGGQHMLVGQAAAAFSKWTGAVAPLSVMLAAAQASPDGDRHAELSG